jgi:hypothetical protein
MKKALAIASVTLREPEEQMIRIGAILHAIGGAISGNRPDFLVGIRGARESG